MLPQLKLLLQLSVSRYNLVIFVSPAMKSRKQDIGMTSVGGGGVNFFLKLYISESINARITKISVHIVRCMKLSTTT